MKTKMKLELSVAEWADNEGWISESVLEIREVNEEITPDNCFDYSDLEQNPNLKYIAIMYEVEIDEFGNEDRNELWRAEKYSNHILLVAGDNCIYGVNPYDPMEISIIGNITMIDII